MKTKWFAVLIALNLVSGIGFRVQADDAVIEVRTEITAAGEKKRPEKPERPERPKKEALSDEVRELTTELRTKFAEFHAEQKELARKFKGASAEERAEIREQMKLNREAFNAAKEEFKDTRKDVSGTLKEHASKLSSELKDENKSGKSRK
jgi:hypothetical protein